MELKELIDKLHDFIEDNRHKQAFELLKKEIAGESNRRSTLSLLRGRYNDYQEDKFNGTISKNKAKKELNRIGNDLFEFIKILTSSDIGRKNVYVHQEITNSILVFTKKEDIDDIRNFFLQLNFINIIVKVYSEEQIDLEKIDLIIFDNQDLLDCPSVEVLNKMKDQNEIDKINDRIKKMELFITSSTKFILHFGNRLFWINKNRDRVQAANSRISLHARTKEVIGFINTYLE